MSVKNPDTYALALGKEVAIGSVDKELRLLWEADKASTNASLINLAVYSEQKDAILKNSEIVQTITREHACRAILIGIDREQSEASIRSWITAHCHLSQGRKSVCCEQISFQLTGRATGRLRNTVFAHLNSDLPLVFWWQGELSDIFSERLYSLIDRFVYDSSEWSDPVASLAIIQSAMDNAESFLPLDLEWTRSYQVRLAIAELFDDPMAARSLSQINRVHIVTHPKCRMAGLQILAWLAHSAGWERSHDLGLDTPGGDVFSFQSAEGVPLTLSLETNDSSAPIGKVELTASDCTVHVAREAGSSHIQQCLEAGDYCMERRRPAGNDEPAALLADLLSRGGKNSLYRSIFPVWLDLLQNK